MDKYRRPWTHELAQQQTWLELLVEWWEDYWEKHPKELRKFFADEDGETVFTETGDPLLDKWEQEIARGIMPDLEEGLSSTEREKLKQERDQVMRTVSPTNSTAPRSQQERMYDSKFVAPGSKDEKALLQKRTLGTDANGEWVDLLPEMKNG